MSTEILIAIASIVVIVLVGWVLIRQPNPEEAADHEPSGESPGSHPAEPGAESQDPDQRPGTPPE